MYEEVGYCNCENMGQGILTALRVPNPLGKKQLFLECRLTVCLYIWMCASLAPEWLDGFYLFSVFKMFSSTGRCPINMNILALEIGALQMSPSKRNGRFLGNGCNDFD
jgi:hypothetical protein